ncbi:MAG: serine hydrolase domain-containing protein [Phycisphaerae bacterium]|jgi:N-acyl-D-amino-acid deacylase|nr:serine hydrolase domain-containing protein [Phycisphaerae bacterium]
MEFLLIAALLMAGPDTAPAPVPVSGPSVAGLESFDNLMTSFVRTHRVPGATLAVVRNGKIVYARGFGYADSKTRRAMKPDSLFRIASLSKPITSAAIMHLVDRKKLSLDDRVWDILNLKPRHGGKIDPRLKKVTVRHLLLHNGGWDQAKSGDPMFRPVRTAKAFGLAPPAGSRLISRFMMTEPLDFEPGSKYAYSNFGYSLLGRVIEAKANVSYERYVRKQLLAKIGVTRMRIGRTLRSKRAVGEVTYHTRNTIKGPSVFPPNVGRPVPWQYGGFHLEAMDAHGGWIASAIDLVRFAREFDKPSASRMLSKKSIAATFARPEMRKAAVYYGLGWSVRPVGKKGKANTWHTGGLPGTSTLLVRRHDGLDWAVLFNLARTTKGKYLANKIDPLVHRAANAVKVWPEIDLLEAKLIKSK